MLGLACGAMRRQGIDRALARRLAPAVAACLCLLAWLPAFAAADEAEVLYDPTAVWVIEIDLPQASQEALEADPEGAYQPATLTLQHTDEFPGDTVVTIGPKEVEMRLKGSASFRDLSEKAAFKLKFPKEGKGTGPLLGLRKMTLNNMVEDPSMTHETLAFALHRALGVPASRTGFVYLKINGEHFGLYLDVENYDNVAMAKKLGAFDTDVQHVYEGENGTDVEPGEVGSFEVDEGPADISDLEGLAAAVAGPDPWLTGVGAHADLEEMTRMWAAEKYSGQFDGYAGGPALDHPNNYFLATGPDQLFRMLPWGQDETWQAANHLPFDGEAGVMFEGCLDDPGCEALYEEALWDAQTTVPSLKLDQLAVCTAELLAPWQQLEEEESTRFEYDAAEIASAIAETRAFIAGRPEELADYLGNTAPAQPAPVDSCPAEEPEPKPQPTPTGGTPPQPPVAATAQIRRSRMKGNFVVTPVDVTGTAELRQRVRARIDGKVRRVCSDRSLSTGPGRILLRCRLPGWALDRLADRPLRLAVAVEATPQLGNRLVAIRGVTAPRR